MFCTELMAIQTSNIGYLIKLWSSVFALAGRRPQGTHKRQPPPKLWKEFLHSTRFIQYQSCRSTHFFRRPSNFWKQCQLCKTPNWRWCRLVYLKWLVRWRWEQKAASKKQFYKMWHKDGAYGGSFGGFSSHFQREEVFHSLWWLKQQPR